MSSLLLLGTQLKVLGTLQSQMLLGLTLLTFQTKNDLTGGLGLLVEHGLGLTSETHLLGIVTTLSLGEVRGLTGLVLGDLVGLVLSALLAGAEGFAFFGYVNHFEEFCLWKGKTRRVSKYYRVTIYTLPERARCVGRTVETK